MERVASEEYSCLRLYGLEVLLHIRVKVRMTATEEEFVTAPAQFVDQDSRQS